MEKTEGYLYIATGTRYIDEAIVSVKSLRQCNPDVHVTLITDEPVDISYFNEIKVLDVDESDSYERKNYKILGLQHSPYDRTLFIDTDTYFIADCKELFQLLHYHDILIAHAPGDRREVIINEKVLEGYLAYNSGVIAFNNNEIVNKLFKDWYILCLKNIYKGDQPPLMHALLTNAVKIYVLHQNYNFRLPFIVSFPAFSVKILHGRNQDFRKIKKIVNKDISVQRAWNPNNAKMILRDFERVAHSRKNYKRRTNREKTEKKKILHKYIIWPYHTLIRNITKIIRQ